MPPAGGRGRPATPRAGSTTPPRPRTPTDSEAAAIPAYGTPAPPSVAATLQSISEFTIVEDAARAATPPDHPELDAYEAPTVTARASQDDALQGEAAPPEADIEGSAVDSADLDALVTVPPFEADQLFESPAAAGDDPTVVLLGSQPEETNDEIAAAFESASEQPASAAEPELIGGSPAMRFAAESLEEIARGIRAGEISLPAIDPTAGPPAVLAAVLATLLAPGR